MLRTPKWLFLVVVLVAGVSGVWWWLRSADDAPRYRTTPLERGSIQASVSSSGTVNPVSQVSVGSQVSGQIKALFADFNTEVKRQQLIARIDPEGFEFKVRQAQADLDAAKATVLNAQANVNAAMANVTKAQLEAANAVRDRQRKQELLTKQFISEAEFDVVRNQAASLGESLKVSQAQRQVAQAQVVSAQAVVQQRTAALSQAQVDLQRTEIRSPVDGVVIKRSVDVGQTVAASLQAPELFVIARNLSDMQVEASIDEADIARVRAGQKATFTVDAFAGRSFEGTVHQVRKAAVSAQNVVTYTAVIAFQPEGSALLPGMTASVRIATEQRENVLKVPNAALRVRMAQDDASPPTRSASSGRSRDSSKSATASARIYVLNPQGQAVAQRVRLGLSDGLSTEVMLSTAPSAERPSKPHTQITLEEGVPVIVAVESNSSTAERASKPAAGGMPRMPF